MNIKKNILCTVFILICCQLVYSAEIVRYVNADAGGDANGVDWTNAYTAFSAWNTAEKHLLELALEGRVLRLKKAGVNLWVLK